MNQRRDLVRFPEQAVKAGQINAMGLIDEILHLVVGSYRQQKNPEVMGQALDWLVRPAGPGRSGRCAAPLRRGVPAGGRLSPAADRRCLPGRRDRRHAQPPGRPGRDADAVAGQRQPGLRALLGAVRRHGAGKGDGLPSDHGRPARLLRDPAPLRPRQPEPGRHAAQPGPRRPPLAARAAGVHPRAVGAICWAATSTACSAAWT